VKARSSRLLSGRTPAKRLLLLCLGILFSIVVTNVILSNRGSGTRVSWEVLAKVNNDVRERHGFVLAQVEIRYVQTSRPLLMAKLRYLFDRLLPIPSDRLEVYTLTRGHDSFMAQTTFHKNKLTLVEVTSDQASIEAAMSWVHEIKRNAPKLKVMLDSQQVE
jgi:hypothetical protein